MGVEFFSLEMFPKRLTFVPDYGIMGSVGGAPTNGTIRRQVYAKPLGFLPDDGGGAPAQRITTNPVVVRPSSGRSSRGFLCRQANRRQAT